MATNSTRSIPNLLSHHKVSEILKQPNGRKVLAETLEERSDIDGILFQGYDYDIPPHYALGMDIGKALSLKPILFTLDDGEKMVGFLKEETVNHCTISN